MSTATNGYVLWESATAVAIATGFERPSANRKTGEMIQVWILAKGSDPVRAQGTGLDAHVCGDCPLRPANGGGCYVNIGQAPYAVWQSWNAGTYPVLPTLEVFRGRMVRFGAYGDPALIPLALLAKIASRARGWTGYTHRWQQPWAQGYKAFIMASADDVELQIKARGMGWRTFRVAPAGSDWKMADEISCPASKEAGAKVQCADCRLCAGTSKPAKSIVIQMH
jgi:hypothetical protein